MGSLAIRLALAGLASLALAAPVPAAESPAAAAASACPAEVAFFEGDVPRLDALNAAAESGSGQAHYLLGSLYRHGSRLKGNPLAADATRAKAHFGQAVLAGELAAMATLAEMELVQRRPLDATIWVQALLHYGSNHPLWHGPSTRMEVKFARRNTRSDGSMETRGFGSALHRMSANPNFGAQRSDYLRNLNLRSYRGLDDRDEEQLQLEIEEYLAGFLAKFGPRIEQGLASTAAREPGCRAPRVQVAPTRSITLFRTKRGLTDPGYGIFSVDVGPQGDMLAIRAVDGVPGFDVALALLPFAREYRFEPAPGVTRRSLLLKVSLDKDAAGLRE